MTPTKRLLTLTARFSQAITFLWCAMPGAARSLDRQLTVPVSSSPMTQSPALGLSGSDALTDGKTLYAAGQYMEALNRFTLILRSDPHNAEAKQYLGLIVEQMKKKSGDTKTGLSSKTSPSLLPEDLRRRLSKRFLLTADLNAVPNVHVNTQDNGASIDMPSDFLFADKTAGLKEQAVPLMDRVSAWLKTFDQPIMIHCYPEETQDPSKNGGLFMQRYAEIYGFFVNERKLDASRFVSAEDLKPEGKHSDDAKNVSTSAPRVVIEIIGLDFPFSDGIAGQQKATAWLEHSIKAEPAAFNPQEGEWSTIDIAGLAKAGVSAWSLTITPETSPDKVIYKIEGKGNVLKRLNWDGRDQNSSFVRPGMYVAVFAATNGSGLSLSKEAHVLIHSGQAEPAAAKAEKKTSEEKTVVAKKARRVKKSAAHESKAVSVELKTGVLPEKEESLAGVAARPAAEAPKAGADMMDASKMATEAPASAAAETEQPAAPEADASSGDSAQAIWKQVIQFDPGQTELKPSLKASLERISKTLEVYPLQKVRIVGFAMASEQGASALAKKRANVIRTILVEQYHVDGARVIIGGGKTVTSSDGSKVEMSITN
jgi:outer membrane protein OmpA-like peptidoglycan-associated protein